MRVRFEVKQNAIHEEGYSIDGILYLNKGDSICNAELRAKAILSILEAEVRIIGIDQCIDSDLSGS